VLADCATQSNESRPADCLLVQSGGVVQIAASVISHFCCERAEIQSGVGQKSSETHTSELLTGAPGAARNRPLSPQLSHLPAGYRMCTASGPWAHQSRWPSACAARPPSAAMSTSDTTRAADSRIPRARSPLLLVLSTCMDELATAPHHGPVRVVPYIKRLDDCFGDFPVRVTCPCGAQRRIEPEALARIAGRSVTLEVVGKRTRCSKCGHERRRGCRSSTSR
jgi:hypothetical protein